MSSIQSNSHASSSEVWEALRDAMRSAGVSAPLIFKCEYSYWRSVRELRRGV